MLFTPSLHILHRYFFMDVGFLRVWSSVLNTLHTFGSALLGVVLVFGLDLEVFISTGGSASSVSSLLDGTGGSRLLGCCDLVFCA